jgi:hypothetical protein
MIHLAVALAVGFVAMMLVWLRLKSLRMPLLVYFTAYTVTTVIGAAALLDKAGLREFQINQPMFRQEDYPLIGSMTYWVLLLSPFFLVPVGAAAGEHAAKIRLADRLAAFVNRDEKYIIPIVYAIASGCAAYCLWKLMAIGAYFPALYFDRTLVCDVRLMKRIELFGELRYLYYAFAYSVLPIAATVALLSWRKEGRNLHAGMFVVLFAAVMYLNIVLYMKANLVVFFLVLLFGCILAKAPLRFLLTLSLIAAACLLLMQGLLGCYRNSFPQTSRSNGLVSVALATSISTEGHQEMFGGVRASAFHVVADAQPTRSQMSPEAVFVDAAVIFVRSVIFRMAASVPYYVQIFSNPDERCGIEWNSLPFFPIKTCYPPTKVGTRVNPGPIQEFLSAPAHIAAYAELGLGYSFIVLLLAGSIMGFFWGITQKVQSLLLWSVGVAVCVFAYYLTQASLIGAIAHSYGFVWYLFPIVAATVIHALAKITILPAIENKSAIE